MERTISYLRRLDWFLLTSVVMLACLGILVLYSTSLTTDGGVGSSGDLGNFWKQVIFAGLGLALSVALAAFNYRQLSALSKALYVLSAVLLLSVLLFGRTVRGTTGWFGIGGFGIQPVEIVKILLIVYLARFFSDHARDPGKTRHVVWSGAAMALPLALVAMQPDLGSTLLLMGTWFCLLLMAGMKRSHLLLMVLLVAVSTAAAWALVLKPYQKDRIAVFWDPGRDPLGRGYNVTQSIIAIGSGGFLGKGLGFGSQSQLRFLPERQTDFIFAVIAEELGFLGVMVMCGLFLLLFFRIWRVALAAEDDFSMYLALGIMFSIAIEVAVNIGGNLRLLPVTGVTLPFVSYGGSSILSKFLAVGIIQSIAVRR